MTGRNSSYSLRSACRDHGRCDCQSVRDLPKRRRRGRRKSVSLLSSPASKDNFDSSSSDSDTSGPEDPGISVTKELKSILVTSMNYQAQSKEEFIGSAKSGNRVSFGGVFTSTPLVVGQKQQQQQLATFESVESAIVDKDKSYYYDHDDDNTSSKTSDNRELTSEYFSSSRGQSSHEKHQNKLIASEECQSEADLQSKDKVSHVLYTKLTELLPRQVSNNFWAQSMEHSRFDEDREEFRYRSSIRWLCRWIWHGVSQGVLFLGYFIYLLCVKCFVSEKRHLRKRRRQKGLLFDKTRQSTTTMMTGGSSGSEGLQEFYSDEENEEQSLFPNGNVAEAATNSYIFKNSSSSSNNKKMTVVNSVRAAAAAAAASPVGSSTTAKLRKRVLVFLPAEDKSEFDNYNGRSQLSSNNSGSFLNHSHSQNSFYDSYSAVGGSSSQWTVGRWLRTLLRLLLLIFLVAVVIFLFAALWPWFTYLGTLLKESCIAVVSSFYTGVQECGYYVGLLWSNLLYSGRQIIVNIFSSTSNSNSGTPVIADSVVHYQGQGYESEINSLADKYLDLQLALQRIKDKVQAHDEKLMSHDQKLEDLNVLIKRLEDSMKASMSKGKTSEQVLNEILSFKIGETKGGRSVTLLNLPALLNDQQEEFQDKQAMLEKIEKLYYSKTVDNGAYNEKIAVVEERLGNVEARVDKLRDDKQEHIPSPARTTAEVNVEDLKEAILPVLLSEIEERVKFSCQTRRCPEFLAHSYNSPLPETLEQLISKAIANYDSDKTGRPDLALEPSGGSILSTRCTKSSQLKNSVVSLWGFKIWSPPNNPRVIIQPGVVPGECWSFEGAVGYVVVKLMSSAFVTGFTMEHIPKSINPYGNIDSAPNEFQVVGLMSENDMDNVHDYGTFKYEDNGEPIQYFPVANHSRVPYPIVELKILSNHGNLQHTCLYRFRVHGNLALGGSAFTAHVQTESSYRS